MKYLPIFLASLLALSACGSDDDPVVTPEPEPEVPTDSLSHDDAPKWTVMESDMYDNSMVIVIASGDMPAQPNASDQLAAFVGESCRGLQVGFTTINDATYYRLSVKSSVSDTSGTDVVLKYYSADKQHIYTAEAFAFVNDGIMGSYSQGYAPKWSK